MPEILLLLATCNGDALAGAIIALSEKRALFLHGASSNHKREFMAPYILHWNAFVFARARQCDTYDMGAISPSDDPSHSFYGMYRFKTGFGGRFVHNSGSWDYPVKKDVYRNFRNWEMVLSQRERGLGVFWKPQWLQQGCCLRVENNDVFLNNKGDGLSNVLTI